MAENVQWIRLKVGMFDGNSFKKIKRAKIGGVSYRDKLTAVWFELLDLAGKSNCNGYLIGSNEIPYQSFEDIAVMLDREEKEIELCMTFFINERMVEIIDDVYCLTNFMQYQNQDGLEKIREQKRIAQAKWRERKRQGLVGVDTTVDTTHNLLSISNSTSQSNSQSISTNSENIENCDMEEKGKKKKVFVPPTIEDVEEYCKQQKYDLVNAGSFVGYYASIGWTVGGKKKMVSWHDAVGGWQSREAERKAKGLYPYNRPQSKSTTQIVEDGRYDRPDD